MRPPPRTEVLAGLAALGLLLAAWSLPAAPMAGDAAMAGVPMLAAARQPLAACAGADAAPSGPGPPASAVPAMLRWLVASYEHARPGAEGRLYVVPDGCAGPAALAPPAAVAAHAGHRARSAARPAEPPDDERAATGPGGGSPPQAPGPRPPAPGGADDGEDPALAPPAVAEALEPVVQVADRVLEDTRVLAEPAAPLAAEVEGATHDTTGAVGATAARAAEGLGEPVATVGGAATRTVAAVAERTDDAAPDGGDGSASGSLLGGLP